MDIRIELYIAQHLAGIVRLSLRAWEPVFKSIEKEMGPDKYAEYYPDWRKSQQEAVESVCANEKMPVWTALDGDVPVGFVGVRVHTDDNMGEVYMVAVDPDAQGRGIASRLIEFAMDWMKSENLPMVFIDTGQDSGHAPARLTYEKLGFEMWPVARYFKNI